MKLEVENLSFSYPQHTVFSRLSFAVDFETLVLMGPSGGGKSTLLRLLCGLEIPQTGAIRWDAETMPAQEAQLKEFRKRIGVVFQSFNLFPHLNVLENICLPLIKVQGVGKEEAAARAMEYLKSFSLADQALKKPSALSGGQKQRVAITRALIVKPRLIFLDEPTSALDPYMTLEVLRMIVEMKAQYPVPVLLVTHNVGFARKMGGEVLIISNGSLHRQGAAETLLSGNEEDIYQKLLG